MIPHITATTVPHTENVQTLGAETAKSLLKPAQELSEDSVDAKDV